MWGNTKRRLNFGVGALDAVRQPGGRFATPSPFCTYTKKIFYFPRFEKMFNACM